MSTKLARIAEIAKERPSEKFTSLAHLLDEAMLKACHKELSKGKAPGIDRVTKEEYEANLDENITNLVNRLKRKAYRPQPVKRTYIPKPGSDKMRPLGIPAYEDKIVQLGLTKILSAIADFLACSFGFRPGRGCHDALKALSFLIETRKVNYIVDADIKGFFDHVDHEWLMKFLSHRVVDPSIHRLIRRILKAGYLEEGTLHTTEEGTPQGGVISPLLANIYLHYALDLWFEKIVKESCRGEAYMVRYADDFVCCFQYKEDAEKFYRALQTRLSKFNLSIAAEKSKIIAFGRFAAGNAARQGKGKPATFDFLGFTHYCGISRTGKFRVKRKTSRKKYKAALSRMKAWIKHNRNMPVWELVAVWRSKLLGHYHYYGITDNGKMLSNFLYDTTRLLFKWLNRRSQRKSFDWEKFNLFLKKCQLPQPKIYVHIYDLKPHLGYS